MLSSFAFGCLETVTASSFLSAELSEFLFLVFKDKDSKRQYIYSKSEKEK